MRNTTADTPKNRKISNFKVCVVQQRYVEIYGNIYEDN